MVLEYQVEIAGSAIAPRCAFNSGSFPQGFVIELLLTLESGIDTLADTVKSYDLLTAMAQ